MYIGILRANLINFILIFFSEIEFEEKYLGFNYNPDRHNKSALDDGPSSKKEIPLPSIPTEYDWRSFNVVTPVKNQVGFFYTF